MGRSTGAYSSALRTDFLCDVVCIRLQLGLKRYKSWLIPIGLQFVVLIF